MLPSLFRHLFTVSFALSVGAACADAQRLADARIGISATHAGHEVGPDVRSAKQTPVWPFVAGGAFVGAAAGVLWLAAEVTRTDDAFVFPIYWVVAGAGGAIVGGSVGFALGAIVRNARR